MDRKQTNIIEEEVTTETSRTDTQRSLPRVLRESTSQYSKEMPPDNGSIRHSPKRSSFLRRLFIGSLIVSVILLIGIPSLLYLGHNAIVGFAQKLYKEHPLSIAVVSNDTNIVERLLAEGADPNDTSIMGHTGLIYCSRTGQFEVAKQLLEAGADPNQRDTLRWTPLHHTILHNEAHIDMITLLVKHGGDVNAVDSSLRTPLHRAAMFGHIEAVKVLLELGANPNKRDEHGWNPRDRALLTHPEVAEILKAATKK